MNGFGAGEQQRQEDREVVTVFPARLGACAVCGWLARHNHFDRALDDVVCACCWVPLRQAEDLCARVFFDAGPLRPRELEAAIEEFELSGTRAVLYIWRPVRA